MEATRHIVHLLPIAVELIDCTMIELAGENPMFRPTLDKFVRGTPAAILLVEFGEDNHEENLRRLRKLKDMIGDLGFGWDLSLIHISEPTRLLSISYAVFCLKKKKNE